MKTTIVNATKTLQGILEKSTIPLTKQKEFLEMAQTKSMALAFDLVFVEFDQSLVAAFLRHNGISVLKQLPVCFSTNGNPVWSFPDKSLFLWSERKGSNTSNQDLDIFEKESDQIYWLFPKVPSCW